MKPSNLKFRLFGIFDKSITFVSTLFVLLVCISLISLDGWQIWQARGVQMRDSEVVAANLARSLAQHAEDVFANADTTLTNLVDRVEDQGTGPAARMRLYALMSVEVGNSPWLHDLFVYDEQGRWVVNSKSERAQNLNNSDRGYFIYHRNHADRSAYIGVPVRSRSSGDWIITVSRRINHADGSFAGVALASVKMDYFQNFYSSFAIGEHGAIDLMFDNGTLLVRRPFVEASIGANFASDPLFTQFLRKKSVGTALIRSPFDGAVRLNAYQHVAHYPLVVDVAMAEDDILDKWRTDAFWHSIGVAVLVIGLGLLGFRMIWQIRSRLSIEQRLAESETRLRMITDNMPAFIAYIDSEQRYRFCNAQYLSEFDLTMNELLGRTMLELFGADAYASIEPFVLKALSGQNVEFERQAFERGPECYSLYHYVPDQDHNGKVRGFYTLVLDITPRKTAELRLSAKEKLLRGLTDHLPALVSYIDRDERYQFNNRPYEKWLDRPLTEITGQRVRDVCSDEIYSKFKRSFDRAITGNRTDFAFATVRDGVKRYFSAAYIPQFDERGEVIGVCSMINDITDLKKVELQLIKLARVDALTGLANRVQFDETLRKAIARSRRSGLAMALMYLDIDHFKTVNDTYGHEAGDHALCEFARRLTMSVRKTDHVARLSGDEFVIILEEMKSEEEADIVARKVLQAMEEPFSVRGVAYPVTTSIGIAILRDDDADPQALLRRADYALYHVKRSGRNAHHADG
ncbi:MAG: diguanylate cyclase [Burkholderiaceae bacterium]|nr:diguanylate cyclase [Burkholderiaceae bacterium]